MDTIVINWWAVLVSAVASMIIGYIWYGPLFGKLWMKLMGHNPSKVTPEQMKAMQKNMGLTYLAQFVLSVLTFYILAHYTIFAQRISGMEGAGAGMINALWIWLGFIMPTVAGNAMWSGKSKDMAWKFFFVMAGYNLILYAVTGSILGGWQ